MITREHIFYINLRQAYFYAPAYASRISSRTVLFTAVTEDYLNKDKIRALFGAEKVKNVWITSDTKELEDKVKERDSAAMKLEGAETKLIVMANKARNKALKKQGNAEGGDADETVGQFDDESGSVAAKWVQAKDRPTHRLKLLIGKKVDTINWARSEIERLSPEIEELQAKHRAGDTKLVSSVFVEFYKQADAQLAYQSGTSRETNPSRLVGPVLMNHSRSQPSPAHVSSLHWSGPYSGYLGQPPHQMVGAHYASECDRCFCLRHDHLLGYPDGLRWFHLQHHLLDQDPPLAGLHQQLP